MKRKQRAAKVQPLPSPQPQQQRQSQPNPKQPEPIVIPSSPGAGITLSSPSFGSALIQDEGFTHGAALPDDFKLW
jgi:mobilization protein